MKTIYCTKKKTPKEWLNTNWYPTPTELKRNMLHDLINALDITDSLVVTVEFTEETDQETKERTTTMSATVDDGQEE